MMTDNGLSPPSRKGAKERLFTAEDAEDAEDSQRRIRK
jgi:hypothetical protein